MKNKANGPGNCLVTAMLWELLMEKQCVKLHTGSGRGSEGSAGPGSVDTSLFGVSEDARCGT